MDWGEPVKGFEDQGSDWIRKWETTELIYNFPDIVKARTYGYYLYNRKERLDIKGQHCISEMILVLVEIKDGEINWEWTCKKKCLNKSFHSVEKEHILYTLKDVSGKHPQDLTICQMAKHGERPKWTTILNCISGKKDLVTVMMKKLWILKELELVLHSGGPLHVGIHKNII